MEFAARLEHKTARGGFGSTRAAGAVSSFQHAHDSTERGMASIDKFNDHCWREVIPAADQQLYSGSIEVDVYAETPLFIADPRNEPSDDREPARSMQNVTGKFCRQTSWTIGS